MNTGCGWSQLDAPLFVRHLKNDVLFPRLAASFPSIEGNLLESADPLSIEAQVSAVRFMVDYIRPHRVMETGTNKGMFAYALSHLTSDVTLFTFDIDPRCRYSVELLTQTQDKVRLILTLGDTRQTLPSFMEQNIDVAWIDGGHDEETAFIDITNAMRLAVRFIAVDDTRLFQSVRRAFDRARRWEPAYREVTNPFSANDAWGIAFLERRG